MSQRSFEEEFRSSARFLPHMLNVPQDRVLVAMLSEADYRQASFLDQRVLGPNQPREWMSWGDLARAARALPVSADFIFHIGHVGSTLISRLLGELPTVLALREPLLLRSFAELHRLRGRPESPWGPDDFSSRLATASGWLSRAFRPDQRAMIKATSFASALAAPILGYGSRSLFLYTSPQTYLETILAGEASLQELAALGGARLLRLHERIGDEPWRLWQLSAGERAAMAWACEMTELREASREAGEGQVLWLDFNDVLADPAAWLTRLAGHFGHPLGEKHAAALAAGPIMNRYSKAPEHGYSPKLREEVLAAARAEHAQEIRRGLAWLEAAAARHPQIGEALSRA